MSSCWKKYKILAAAKALFSKRAHITAINNDAKLNNVCVYNCAIDQSVQTHNIIHHGRVKFALDVLTGKTVVCVLSQCHKAGFVRNVKINMAGRDYGIYMPLASEFSVYCTMINNS